MAQIPTSSITMSAIIAEVGLSGSQTLDACRAASVAYTMSSTSVPGHTRDGNEQTNTNASPWNNTMAEWAGYVHAQDIGDADYFVRFSTPATPWPQTTYGLFQNNSEHDGENLAESEREGGIYLFTKQVSGQTWVYADRIIPAQGDTGGPFEYGRRYLANGTYDSMGSMTSNDGSAADVIIKIDEANVVVTVDVNIIHGFGDEPEMQGYPTPNLSANSGATYIAGSAQGAGGVGTTGPDQADSGAIFRMALTATKTGGYNDLALDGDITGGQLTVYSYNEAISDLEE